MMEQVNDWRELALQLASKLEQRTVLLEICQEIASDARVDLVTSDRRLRLYHAIKNAGGEI